MHFTYKQVTEKDFDYMHECLPPDSVRAKTLERIKQDLWETFKRCFMNSEPVRHVDWKPTYSCYIEAILEGETVYYTIGDVVNE